jgi:hypothetical protein
MIKLFKRNGKNVINSSVEMDWLHLLWRNWSHSVLRIFVWSAKEGSRIRSLWMSSMNNPCSTSSSSAMNTLFTSMIDCAGLLEKMTCLFTFSCYDDWKWNSKGVFFLIDWMLKWLLFHCLKRNADFSDKKFPIPVFQKKEIMNTCCNSFKE